jgi:hypothetical protein
MYTYASIKSRKDFSQKYLQGHLQLSLSKGTNKTRIRNLPNPRPIFFITRPNLQSYTVKFFFINLWFSGAQVSDNLEFDCNTQVKSDKKLFLRKIELRFFSTIRFRENSLINRLNQSTM